MPKGAVDLFARKPPREPPQNPLRRIASLRPRDGGDPKRALLCDDCASLLSFAIADPVDETAGVRGERIWAGAEKVYERCWSTMRAPK